MIIKQMAPSDPGSVKHWNEFVFACPDATFFHRAEWQEIICKVFRHPTFFLYAEKEGEIVGVLPLAHVNSRLFGNSLVSLPFAVYAGVASSDREAIAGLEAEAQQLAVKLGVDHLEFRNISARHADWPTQDLYVTFRKEIQPDVEANMLAIPRKQRAMVRKGIKNCLKSQVDRSSDRFFALFADNVHRHGTPALPKRYFDTLLEVFGDDCEILTITSSEDKLLSSVLSFYFRDEVLPYYAGDDEAARDLAANDFKYWELMRRSCERGLRIFDYGRSKIGTGPYAFKKNWGFEPQPLHYEYCLYKRDSIPQNNPNNAKYKLFIEAWRRMPIGLANWLGPHIVRNLG
ncbi:FemAB family XrtA/PEP-CTERM system-associated protein [Ferribacterium limneticum]|uniref:FemAB family XrtA/PEP-CTERM system-associated protein n=1 Tax=Ferribacterium limneticum TaxID=76259 RepID=UPI001CF8C246|nr:FemAB family XrtA/PEP-CTERM system-associated protein [Ferribacterium limneticum]UCV24743.1 FemAB family PEP-CTERM system-associated protein [Ferribacterium limneticum]